MFYYVIGPRFTMAATLVYCFLLGLWDVESMILVIPPGGETLALRIFNLLHYGHNAQVKRLFLCCYAGVGAVGAYCALPNQDPCCVLRVPSQCTCRAGVGRRRNTQHAARYSSLAPVYFSPVAPPSPHSNETRSKSLSAASNHVSQ